MINHLLISGLDVAVYTRERESRPWLGRVVNVVDESQFTVHWYEKSGSKGLYNAISNNNAPFLSVIDNASVILWAFSTRVSEFSFKVTSVMKEQIMSSYNYHDRCYI